MKNSLQLARFPVLSLFLATGAMVAVLGCPPTQPPVLAAPALHPAATDSGPCPHYFNSFFATRYPEGLVWKLIGHQIDVPEYNDCQRLLLNNSSHLPPAYTDLHFGNVAVIFARANLKSVYQLELPIGTAIGPFSKKLKNPNPATTRVTTIAVAWTTGAYTPLGLPEGFACVVLQWEPPVAPSEKRYYHAWLVSVTPNTNCAYPLELNPSAASYLGAEELPAQKNADGLDEIPSVARWDWDPTNGVQYIGIACPSGWCDLYGEGPHKPHKHRRSPDYEVTSELNLFGKDERVVRQKGWYDEEYLASTSQKTGTGPALDAAGAFGTIFPVPELKDRTIDSYSPRGKFVPVAWISNNSKSSGYLEKYGIRQDAAPSKRRDVNVVSLCLDDGTNLCKPKLRHACSSTRDKSSGYFFYARIGRSADDVDGTDFCVDYIGTDPTVSTPGTVRWRWLDNDQTVWVSCPAGCCQIKPPV